jgi:hypothetical protein
MNMEFDSKKYTFLRYFIGDIFDEKRLCRALEGIDIVPHKGARECACYAWRDWNSRFRLGCAEAMWLGCNSIKKKVSSPAASC